MNGVAVSTFNKPEEAEPLKKRLEAAGVTAQIYDERKRQQYLFLSETLAGIHVRVDKEDYWRAKSLMVSWDDAEGVLRQAVHCPECRSTRVEFPQFTRKFLSPSFYALVCKLGLLERTFYCEDCHFTWSLRPANVEQPTDLLGWPKK
jgi:predicted Zn-ribbon and HTH transcriptional regulator